MTDRPAAPVPSRPTPSGLRATIRECRACDLWEAATQPVMGEGQRRASVMLVGELVMVTTHPSAILRAPDDERSAAMERFVSDLRTVADWLGRRRAGRG